MSALAIVEPRAMILLGEARRLLVEARSLDDVKNIRDQAAAIRHYMRQQSESLEIQNAAAEIKIRAERRAGELLHEMPKHNGDPLSRDVTRLSELGISRMKSHRWQKIASLPESEFEGFLAETRAAGRELTSAGALKLANQRAAQSVGPYSDGGDETGGVVVHNLGDVVRRGQRFRCVYADPPWQYGNQGTRASTDNHYRTMSVEEICAEPVAELVEADAHLHLWATAGFFPDAFKVIEAWGFKYKGFFAWVKPQMGLGNYWRNATELLLLGMRGRLPFGAHNELNWGMFDRVAHSAKPAEIRAKIERVSPGPRIELYGRVVAPGWSVFGDQVDAA